MSRQFRRRPDKNRFLPLPRRSFLKALGLGPAVLPLLEAEQVRGQADVPKYAFFLVWCNGMMNRDEDWPGPGTAFTLPDFMQVHEPHREDMIFIDGLNYRPVRDTPNISERTGHAAFPAMLTGALYERGGSGTSSDVGGGISIDQYIGNELRNQGYDGLVSLNLGVKVDSTARLSWRSSGNAIVPNEDPYDVFDNLFAGVMSQPSGDTGPDPAVVRVNEMRASILDYLVGDLGRFSESLGMADRGRIDNHLTSVRELELQLQVAADTAQGGGGGFELPTLEQGINTESTVNFHTTTEMMMQITAAAFAADVTRVSVLQLGDQGGSNIVITPLGFDPNNSQKQGNTGLVEGLHVIAHDNSGDKRRTDGWFQEQVANMVQLMKDTPSGGGTLIDNSVMLAMSNMRTGNHEFERVPAVMAGSVGGYFATGRSVSTTAANNGAIIAIANAVGVPTETFGEAQYGGELSDLRP